MEYLEQGHRDFLAGRATHCPRIQALFPTMTDPTMAPEGRHLLSINAWFYTPDLAGTTWATERDAVARNLIDHMTRYIPSLKRSIIAQTCYSPDDLEREYGLLGGNFAHLDMTARHMFGLRPLPELSGYRTPVRGLYLCGAGTWPGGTVTGLPGHNASHQALRDRSRTTRTHKEAV
jgi:phytoene dehydrogenase-like protein